MGVIPHGGGGQMERKTCCPRPGFFGKKGSARSSLILFGGEIISAQGKPFNRIGNRLTKFRAGGWNLINKRAEGEGKS